MATMALFNMAVNWFIRQRIDQIQNFMNHPIETQQGVLFLNFFTQTKQNTEKIRLQRHLFLSRFSAAQVPIVNYEEFEPYIEKKASKVKRYYLPGIIRQFAKSSGTTNAKSKYIPITDESLEECHYKAGKDLILFTPIIILIINYFLIKFKIRRQLRTYESFNTKFGDLSAILIENLPFWIEITTVPSKNITNVRMGNQTESHCLRS